MNNKNSFFTFVTACIPGTGYMYYGLMKKGFEASLCFFLLLQITNFYLFNYLLAGLLVPFWFYTFFDTYNVRKKYLNNEIIEDKSILLEFNLEPLTKNKLLITILGVFIIFIGFNSLMVAVSNNFQYELIYQIVNFIQSIVIPGTVIILGIIIVVKNKK